MDYLFTPWRFSYVAAPRPEGPCVLCSIGRAPSAADPESFVVHRGETCYVVLNIYPYNPGHLMVVPYAHVARLAQLGEAELGELMSLTARAEAVLESVYHPQGINIGMNLGVSAGAGIAEHLHLHVVPRWTSDTNFMTVTGETRVLPEDLPATWKKFHGRF